MTSKQILDAFSETLIGDERILSSRERELVMALLQNAKGAAGGNREIQAAVLEAVRRSVGETVAQREAVERAFWNLPRSNAHSALCWMSSCRPRNSTN